LLNAKQIFLHYNVGFLVLFLYLFTQNRILTPVKIMLILVRSIVILVLFILNLFLS